MDDDLCGVSEHNIAQVYSLINCVLEYDRLSCQLAHVFLCYKLLTEMDITLNLWHNIIQNRCMSPGLNQ